MKKCIHCGAAIKGSAAAFCPKCKKPQKKTSKQNQSVPKKPPSQTGKTPAPVKQQVKKKKPLKKTKTRPPVKPKSKKTEIPAAELEQAVNPMDENYDGYYDDRPTDDNGHDKDGLEPELIKRIAIIAGGTAGIVIFAIILMLSL